MSMTEKPLCRYCGEHNCQPHGVEMRLVSMETVSGNNDSWYECPHCGSRSPRKSTTFMLDAKRWALRSALRTSKPMQKPLTISDLCAIQTEKKGPERQIPLLIESKDSKPDEFWCLFVSVNDRGETNVIVSWSGALTIQLRNDTCGIDWRPWLALPTAEERAAAPWEDGSDE